MKPVPWVLCKLGLHDWRYPPAGEVEWPWPHRWCVRCNKAEPLPED
jgi:hypothetical protein